jgi:hypothetical protein
MFSQNSTRKWLCIFLCGLGLAAAKAPAQSKEYQIKGAFLYNFAQFVAWPPEAFPDNQSPLVIGVLGENPFGDFLDGLVQGAKVNSHPLVVQHYNQASEIQGCDILFISRSEAKQVDEILADLKGRDILTVSDIDGFTAKGGIIQFTTENNKIRFQINLEAAKAASLSISSKLLKCAESAPPGRE